MGRTAASATITHHYIPRSGGRARVVGNPTRQPIRRSYGVILTRYNQSGQCYEFLLEQRPYRYGFVQMITHRYGRQHSTQILHLMNDMSPEDKIALASLNYDLCYRRIYSEIPQAGQPGYGRYISSREHFQRMMTPDAGEWLLRLLNQSTTCGLHWDLPRGRKTHNRERDLNCALREFEEETGIPAKDLAMLEDRSRTQTYQTEQNQYHHSFYLARLRNPYWHHPQHLRIDYTRREQTCEAIALRWMSLPEIRIVDTYGHLHEFLQDMVRVLRRYRIRESLLYHP